MGNCPLAPQDVWNVLAGRSAAGEPRLERPLSFPRSEEVRHELERFIVNLGNQLRFDDADVVLPDHEKSLLIAKVASWLVATGRANVEGIRTVYEFIPLIAAATARFPEWVHRCGVTAAVALAQSRTAPQAELTNHDGPPTLCWQGPNSVLLELTTSAHLVEQGALARNCLGSCYDNVCSHLDADPSLGGLPLQLRYLRLIRSGKTRLFALRALNGTSLATIEYNTKRRYISTFEVIRSAAISRIDALADVFAAFQSIRLLVQLAADGSTPELVARCFRGEPKDVSDDVPVPALASVIVTPDIGEETFARLFSFHHLRVDLTALPRRRIDEVPARVACHLYSEGENWPSQLHTVLGSVHFPALREANFSQLNYCGHAVSFPALAVGAFPNLEVVRGNALFASLEDGAFPKLHIVLGREDFGQLPRDCLPCLVPKLKGEGGPRRRMPSRLPPGMTLRLARMLEAHGGTPNLN